MGDKKAYLMLEDVKVDLSLKRIFNTCVNKVLEGTAQITKTKPDPGYMGLPTKLITL
jgi:hypothetical protein